MERCHFRRYTMVVVFGAFACQSPPANRPQKTGVHLDIPDRVVSLDVRRHSADISFTITNSTRHPVSIPRCGSLLAVSVDRFEKDWIPFARTVCPGASTPGDLESGKQYASTFTLLSSGRYRLTVTTWWSRDSAGIDTAKASAEVYVR